MGAVGLVLEGGGMRGIYTAGVLDVFLEEGISFDGILGVSAGAIHGGTYLAGQRGRNIRYYKTYCNDPRFISLRNFLTTGNVAQTQFCYHDLPEQLDPFDYEAFQTNAAHIPFYAVCSNVETGRAVYIRIRDMRQQIDAIRASASLPFLSQVVSYRGKKLLDGGCVDSIPIQGARQLGFERNVVVLTQHRGYQKKAGATPYAKLVYHRYPAFARALAQRAASYNHTLEALWSLERAGTAFVLCPSAPLDIGRLEHSADKLQQVYDLGRQDTRRQLTALRQWMDQPSSAPSPTPLSDR